MTTLESIRIVARHFNGLGIPYTFLGASVLPLLVDHPELLEIRPTLDIDFTVEIATLADFYRLEAELRAIGFQNDTREGAPICRWITPLHRSSHNRCHHRSRYHHSPRTPPRRAVRGFGGAKPPSNRFG